MGLWPKKADDTFDDSKLPESLRGKTPEQIAQALIDADVAKTAAEAKARGDLEKLNADKVKAEGELAAAKARIAALDINNRGDKKENQEEEEEELTPAAKKQLDKVLEPMKASLQAQAAQQALMMFRSMHNGDPVFSKFSSEFETKVAALPVWQKAMPEVLENVWKILRADHMSEVYELEKSRKASGADFGVGGGSGGGTGPTGTGTKPEDKLTDQERAQASKYRIDGKIMSPAQYAEMKARMTFVA